MLGKCFRRWRQHLLNQVRSGWCFYRWDLILWRPKPTNDSPSISFLPNITCCHFGMSYQLQKFSFFGKKQQQHLIVQEVNCHGQNKHPLFSSRFLIPEFAFYDEKFTSKGLTFKGTMLNLVSYTIYTQVWIHSLLTSWLEWPQSLSQTISAACSHGCSHAGC